MTGWDRAVVVASGVVVASPLVFDPGGYQQFQLPKLLVQGLAVIVALVALVTSGRLSLNRVLVPLAAFLLALTAAALVSRAPMAALVGADSRRFGVLGWCLLAAALVVGMGCSSTADRSRLIRVLLISSAVAAAYALAQRVGHDPFQPERTVGVPRPGSTMGSATYLGGYLALAIGVGAALLVSKVEWWRWLAGILIIDVIALLTTQSRGAWLGAAVAVTIAVVRAMRGQGRRVGLLVGGAFAGLALLTVLLVPGLSSRVASLRHPSEGTAGARFELAGMGLRAVAARPILGWGPDQSRPALHDQISRGFERTHFDDRIEDRVHNWFIDIAVWSGVVGLGLFVWFLLRWFVMVRGQSGDWTVFAIGLGLVAFAVHLMFNFPVPDLDAVAWLLAGSLVPRVERNPWSAPAYMTVPVGVILAAIFLVPGFAGLQADRSLRDGFDHENAGDLLAAKASYVKATVEAPGSELCREALARFLLRTGDPSAARVQVAAGLSYNPSDPYMSELLAQAEADEALHTGDKLLAGTAERRLLELIDVSPFDGSLHLNLGIALAVQGNLDAAVDEFKTSTELVPYRSEPFRNLGLIAEQRGQLAEARLYFMKATQLDPNDWAAVNGLGRVEKMLGTAPTG